MPYICAISYDSLFSEPGNCEAADPLLTPVLIDCRAHPDAAKKLDEAIAAVEKTYVSGGTSVAEDPIARLGRGFQHFKTTHYE